jgi:transposase-like protein
MSEDELAEKLETARALSAKMRRYQVAASDAEDALGQVCVELYDGGLSVMQIAKGLDVSRREAQRLIGRGRMVTEEQRLETEAIRAQALADLRGE